MIIDVHGHLGYDYTFDEDFTLEEHLEKHKDCKVDITILQPGTCHNLQEAVKEHDAIAEACKNYPGKFYGMANPSPHLTDDEYNWEIKRCIEKLGFVGIKIHPFAHGVNPLSRDGRKVFEIANYYKVPVMMHTGSGIPFANPSNLIPIAKQYPELKLVFAHCGQMVMAAETVITMELFGNIYADSSWSPGFSIKGWSDKLGANRFMLGADHADNCATELAKLRTSGLSEEQLDWVLYKTALEVYGINK
ncbi:MAG TPA: amidohydrolase family protein [Clostridia bacterium]|nr:amidohydrolase family protein [Clostridia bacterium]